MTTYTEIRTETIGHVEVLTIDRPEARNALTHTTYAELTDAVTSTTARCLVLTGTDPAFCSGDDVKKVMANFNKEATSGQRLEARLTPAAGALLGTTRDRLLGSDAMDHFPNEARELWWAQLDAVSEGSEPRRFRASLRDVGGASLPVDATITRFATRSRTLALIIARV
jgi:hypothetical protein